ncbi:MAG: hypothetical protein JXR77_19000, partial [Lentisphaeria bacterium]|nr:hypothetical protein [Lentisphaeria bacterium]
MTSRAVILGLLGAAAICALSYLNDQILQQTYLVGNNMPVAVYGLLILVTVLLNPVLRRFALTGRELAVILTLTLAACCIPGSGLLRTFTNSLMLPHHYVKTEPGWQQQEVMDLIPPAMLADPSADEDRALTGFLQGLGEPQNPIGIGEVPWPAWTRTLIFWLPIILCLWGALIALSLVTHRQWADHEHLPYPVAEFAGSLLPEAGRNSVPVYGRRLFWIGAGAVFAIHLNNFLNGWFPDTLIPIPVRFDLTPLARIVPVFVQGGGTRLLAPTLFFTVIGLSYFLAGDVAFSCGIGPFLWALVTGMFATYGITLTGAVEGIGYPSLRVQAFLNFGANLGLFLTIVYLGRRYYLSVLRRAVGLRCQDDVPPAAVWGMRVFLVLAGAFTGLLWAAGLAWQFALLYTAAIVIFFLMISRVMAETGMFYVQPYWFPCGVLWGLFGAQALGLRQLMILLTLSMVLVVDPRESIMPFMSTSLKLLDLRRAGLGKAGAWSGVAVVLGLAIALPLTLYFQYDRGVSQWDGWARAVPRMQFENITLAKQKLDVQGTLQQSENVPGWRRFASPQPNAACVAGLVAGMGLVLLFSAARIRFTRWPLHPILFLTWAT